jgi:tetratricopeptide (TPR) repeat protein
MTTRRPLLFALMTGLSLAAAAAALSVFVFPGLWGRVGTVGAAIATFGVVIAQGRVAAAMGQSDQERTALARGIFMPGGKPSLVEAITNPVDVGVHTAPRLEGAPRLPPYVPRDVDPELRRALSGPGFVLVVGDAAAGKTRAAYEAMRTLLAGHVLIAPTKSGELTAALTAARAQRDCVLWLDSLQRHLGAEAITSRQIAELLAGDGHHRVVLATLRATQETRLMLMAGSLPGGESTRDGQAVLDQVTSRIVIGRLFSEPERARAAALARDDRRLADALAHADRYGIAEYLSSGPQLHTEWQNGWERGAHPRGAALVTAAVDCRRAGYTAPLPRALLDELHQEYLQARGGMLLRPEPLEAAWRWATDLRDSGGSPLWSAGHDRYDVFDYLADAADREPSRPVAERTVYAALRHARPGDAMSIAATAWYHNRPELAEAGFRAAYTELSRTDGPNAATTLSSRSDLTVTLHAMRRLPDAEAEAEYRAILTARAAALGAAHPDTQSSRNNLAVVLHEQRRFAEAEAEYRDVLDVRVATLGPAHPDTLTSRNNLGVVLGDLGRLQEAQAELEETARLREEVLGAGHPHTIISRDNLAGVRRRRASLLSAGADPWPVLSGQAPAKLPDGRGQLGLNRGVGGHPLHGRVQLVDPGEQVAALDQDPADGDKQQRDHRMVHGRREQAERFAVMRLGPQQLAFLAGDVPQQRPGAPVQHQVGVRSGQPGQLRVPRGEAELADGERALSGQQVPSGIPLRRQVVRRVPQRFDDPVANQLVDTRGGSRLGPRPEQVTVFEGPGDRRRQARGRRRSLGRVQAAARRRDERADEPEPQPRDLNAVGQRGRRDRGAAVAGERVLDVTVTPQLTSGDPAAAAAHQLPQPRAHGLEQDRLYPVRDHGPLAPVSGDDEAGPQRRDQLASRLGLEAARPCHRLVRPVRLKRPDLDQRRRMREDVGEPGQRLVPQADEQAQRGLLLDRVRQLTQEPHPLRLPRRRSREQVIGLIDGHEQRLGRVQLPDPAGGELVHGERVQGQTRAER